MNSIKESQPGERGSVRRKRMSVENRVSRGLLVVLAWGSFALSPAADRIELRDFPLEPMELQPPGWTAWAPRQELLPRCYVDTRQFRSPPSALAVSGNSNAAAYGGWTYLLKPVQPDRYYRLEAHYRTRSVAQERRQVVVRLDWLDAEGRRVGYPDYGHQVEPAGDGWKRIHMTVPAPAGAVQTRLELFLAWSPQGTVWWDDLTFQEVPAPSPRPVRLGSVSLRPRDTGGKPGSVQAFLQALDAIGPQDPDIVCLGEGITLVGSGETYVSVAEPVPGPTTEQLAEKARQYQMYLVAGLYEREGSAVYNTAVLIDRQGKVVGKYRKVNLPREEIEGGLTPGTEYPVFDTDFGRVGLLICWDIQYTDAARSLAAQGAEIILVPIWGGSFTLMQARALENHVYLVTAGYDCETAIINPVGEVLHSTTTSGVFKTVTVDLSRRWIQPWLGDMRARFFKEFLWDRPTPTP